MKDFVSVVMTTYNGERYVCDQMESLRNQTLHPDEVLILDDCSTDGTAESVEQYIKQYSLDKWKLFRNKENIGWKRNYKRGLDLASGTYVFPCDQDDIWDEKKCEIMVSVMQKRPDLAVLACNYQILFSEKDYGSSAYLRNQRGMRNNGNLEIRGIHSKWLYVNRPGCTYCLRRSFYEEIRGEWDTEIAHDAILWRYAQMRHGLGILGLPLVHFRRHGDNATSRIHKSRDSEMLTLKSYLSFVDRALQETRDEKERQILCREKSFYEMRIQMYEANEFRKLPGLLVKHRQDYLTLRGWLADFYLMWKG